MQDSIKIYGRVRLQCHDADGNLKWDTGFIDNLVTSAGKAQIALLVGDASATPFTFLAVGSSTTAPAVGQTTLGTEITTNGLERAAATISRVTTTVTNDTFQAVKAWTSTGSHTVEEIGVFNASSSGTMLARALTGTRTVVSGEILTATYKVTFA